MDKKEIFLGVAPIVKVRNLKGELMAVLDKYKGTFITRSTKEEIYNDLYAVFGAFHLSDFNFRIIENRDSSFTIEPIGQLNNYALKGILSDE